jgi:hypothetical protein
MMEANAFADDASTLHGEGETPSADGSRVWAVPSEHASPRGLDVADFDQRASPHALWRFHVVRSSLEHARS